MSTGREPVCPSQTPTPENATYTCPAYNQSPWIKRKERPDISFHPPITSTPAREEVRPHGNGARNVSAPANPVASPASFYGNWNESYGGCPANFKPYKYPDHVSAGECISPIRKKFTADAVVNTFSTEEYTEDFTEDSTDDFTEGNDSSGEIDTELMGKIIRGDIGRVLVWPTPPDAETAAENATYNRNLTYNKTNLTYDRGNLCGGYELAGETDDNLMGRQPVQRSANVCPAQNHTANATYCEASPLIKRKEKPDISFQPPFASTPATGEKQPCGIRNVSAPVKPVASPATVYGNWSESYGGCPANFKPYKYPEHVSMGQHMSPIQRDLALIDKIVSDPSIETFTEEVTEEFESSGEADTELMGQILRGDVGRVLVWPTPPDASNAAPNVTYNKENLLSKGNNFTYNARSLPSDVVNKTFNQNVSYTVAPPNDLNHQLQQTYTVNNKSCQPCSYNQSSEYDSRSTTSAGTHTQEFSEEFYDSSDGDIDDSLLGKIMAGEIGRVLVWPTPPGQAAAEGNICNQYDSPGTQINATYTASKSPCSPAENQTYSKNVKFVPGRTGNFSNVFPIANSTGIENSPNYLEENNYTYNVPHNAARITSNSSDNRKKKCCKSSNENIYKDFAPTANSTGIENSPDYLDENNNSTNAAESFSKTFKKTSKRRTKTILTPRETSNNINESSSFGCNKKGDANAEAGDRELEQLEAVEQTRLETDLRNWQEARRKLILDAAQLTSSDTSTNYKDDGCC